MIGADCMIEGWKRCGTTHFGTEARFVRGITLRDDAPWDRHRDLPQSFSVYPDVY
jgi:hypothetical protein